MIIPGDIFIAEW